MALTTTRVRALIVVTAVAACIAGIGNTFVQDDIAILTEDTRLQDVGSWGRFFTEPYWPPPYAPDQYRPLTSILLSIEYIAGAGSPVVVRVVSYGLYALASLLVFGLARRALGTGRDTAAALAALLFAAHPVHVEATALGVGQAELLVAILTLLAANRYLDARRVGMLPGHWWLLYGLYGTASLSKEQGILLPAFILLCEGLLIDEGFALRARALWRGYAGFVVVGGALLLIRALVLDSLAPQNVAEALVGADFGTRALTALRLVPEWTRLLLWPAHLRLDYSPIEFRASSGFGATELLGAALLVTFAVFARATRRHMPAIAFGLAWSAVALFPVSNLLLPTGVLVAERTLFLPSAGWMLMIGGLIALGAELPRARLMVVHGVAGALIVTGVFRSLVRQREWRDSDALTRAASRDSPSSWRANANHADLLFREGRLLEGRAAYERAIAYAPSPWWVRHAYARHLYIQGEYDRALQQLATALAEHPDQPLALRDAIAILIALGRYAEAEQIAAGTVNRGRTTPDIIRLGRLADSARSVGAPAGSIRVELGDPTTPPGTRR